MLTPKQVADELSVNAATIIKWARAKKIRALIIPGGRCAYRFDRDYIDELKRQGSIDGPDQSKQEVNVEGLKEAYGKKAQN